jgi:DNA-3-methyladenine glycosylase II
VAEVEAPVRTGGEPESRTRIRHGRLTLQEQLSGTRRARRSHRLIVTDDDIKAGVRALTRKCAIIRRLAGEAGALPLRRREPGFEGLARIVVGQQLSIASAAAIWGKVEQRFPGLDPYAILAADDQTLRSVGLSGGKIRTLRAVATAVAAGLDLTALAGAPETEIHERLTEIHGIGPWTADIFIMFCLGRADGFAAGDLALQIAAQHAFELAARPSSPELLELAERWRPWRGVAARVLWAWYPTLRNTKPGQPV